MIVRHTPQFEKGFSLLEMVIVLGIIGLILAAAVKYATGIDVAAKYTATKGKMNETVSKIEAYRLVSGRYPTEEQGLASLVEKPTIGPVPKRWVQQHDVFPKDAWERELVYQYPSRRNKQRFEVFSLGPDGELGTDDDVSSFDQ